MSRRLATRLALLLPCLLLLSACSSLGTLLRGEPRAPAAAAPPQRLAYELEIDAPDALRALLQEHLDLARFQHVEAQEALSRAELERLVAGAPAQARSLLETEGYFNAQVLPERPAADAAGLQRVRLRVTPGPRTRVTRLDLAFAGALEEPVGEDARRLAEALRQRLQRDFGLPEGQPFRQSRWSAAKTETLAQARAGGYPLARWTLTAARVQTERNEAELELLLDSGPLVRLGELQIEGLQAQDEAVVRRLAGFEPGQPYSERALLDFQERLLQTLLFDGATVDILPEASQAEATPVLVRLREAPLQQATSGVGYNANTGQRVTFEHLHRKPFGLAARSLTKLDLGRDLRSASLELTSHPQSDMHRNLGSLALEEDRSGDGVVTTLVGRLGRLRETPDFERLDYLELLRSHERQSGSASLNAGALSINTQRIWRRLDSRLLPERGRSISLLLGLGQANSSAGPDGPFARADLKLGYYRPLSAGWHFSGRLEAGQVLARDAVGLPDKLLFRAGGDDSVRGYAYRSLGPEVNGQAVGGRVLLTGSAELARPISTRLPMLWGAVFVDAGQAAERWSALHPVVGWGAGLRLRSPVGPLRVDIARGQALGQWRLHFSVGIAL